MKIAPLITSGAVFFTLSVAVLLVALCLYQANLAKTDI